MAHIETVLGKISPDDIGLNNYHDHLITIGGGEEKADRDLRLDRVDYAIDAMKRFKDAGGGSLVDMNPIDCGRQIEMLRKISSESGVHIIACTGFQRAIYYDNEHWVNKYALEDVARLIAEEVTEGIETNNYNGPIVTRSKAKAGVIKFATHYNCIRPMEMKALKAACIASRETGAPISTHTERGTMGLEVIGLLRENGVDPERVILGHVDRNPDLAYHKKMAAQGVTLGYDGPSRAKYWPDSMLVQLIKGMCAAGYADRIVLGGDNGRASMWPQYGGGYGHNYIIEKFVPRLLEEGVSEKDVHKFLYDNPKRQFSFA
ncbi:MAG: phosphotriesterase-related protein [Bacillota bacterium]